VKRPAINLRDRAQRTASLAVLLVLCAAPANAQAPPELLPALAAAERRQAETSLPLREREVAMDRAIELRQQLIQSAPETDDRLPGWLMEQSAALLARLARDGADTAVLLGIPLPTQRQSAREAATEAAALLTRAQRLIGPAKADEERIYEQDRTVRIPFFLARAEVLLAATADRDSQVRHATAAGELIGPLSLAATGPEAVRRVNLGLARLLRARDAEDAQVALDEFAWVAMREPRDARAIAPITRAEAWMGLLHASAQLNRSDALLGRFHEAVEAPPFVSQGSTDVLLTVLAADAATRALTSQALRSKDPALLEAAAREQSRLLRRSDLPLRSGALRPLVYEKLAAVADEVRRTSPDLVIPAEMQVARAVVMAREAENRDEAIVILRAVCSRPEPGDLTPDALWELAVLLSQPARTAPEDRAEAAALLIRLASEYPAHTRAGEAMSAALAFARTSLVEAEADTPEHAAVRATYARALSVATQHYPRLPEIDLWRYERARLILEGAQQAPGDADPIMIAATLAEALETLEPVDNQNPIAVDATRLAERIHARRLEMLWRPAHEARHRGAAAAAMDLLLPPARQAAAWARASDSPMLEPFRLDLADALALGGPASSTAALAIYERVISGLDTPEHRHLLPRARLGKARVIRASDPAAAFALLRLIAQELEPRITPTGGAEAQNTADLPAHDVFWESWALMVEIVASQADDSSRAASLRVHVRRLETLDPALGGDPWRRRILLAIARE
jgi:hypothetical protein